MRRKDKILYKLFFFGILYKLLESSLTHGRHLRHIEHLEQHTAPAGALSWLLPPSPPPELDVRGHHSTVTANQVLFSCEI